MKVISAKIVGVFLNEGDTPETVWKIQDGSIITKSVGHRRRKIQS